MTRATFHGSVMSEPGTRYGVVVAKFNSLITKGLLEGAMETFESHGVPADNVDVSWGPVGAGLSLLCGRVAACCLPVLSGQ